MKSLQREPETAPEPSGSRIEWLERRLAAANKVNHVLIDRLERRAAADSSAFSMIEQNAALESIVSRKTHELEAERAALHKTLDNLRATQTRLLQAEKMESIGQLAAGMAHEINTPIQYITDNVSFVGRCFEPVMSAVESSSGLITDWHAGKLTAERIAEAEAGLKRLKFDYIKNNIPAALAQSLEGLQRVASIVAAMKNFSHPCSDSKELVDLADIVKTATTVSRNEWKYVAELEVTIEPGLPQVPCLRNEIGQVVMNLVVNAAHAMTDAARSRRSSEKGKLTVEVHRVGAFAEIRIQDTGTGIPEAIRCRVFDPFFTTKPVGVGTGQGLAICYSIVVEKHSGELFFETEAGRGTVFFVRLPLVAEPDGST